jgi:subtilisin family serine protease
LSFFFESVGFACVLGFGDNKPMKYFDRFMQACARAAFFACGSMSYVGISNAASPEQVAANPASAANVTGLIVKFDKSRGRDDARMRTAGDRATAFSSALSRHAGRTISLNYARELASGAELHRFDAPRTLEDATALAATVSQLPGVAYATPNRMMFTQAIPLDAQYGAQWGFRYSPTVAGANFESAWDVTRGNAAQTIGVVDSGIAKAHPELAGQMRTHPSFPFGGYDFMKNGAASGDGDGRDADPEQSLSACGHGSHVSGTIAAATKFSGGGAGVGVAGGASASKVLMARALDFTGEEADVIDAMLWLAGLAVPGVATNPNPAKVINMSLGGAGAQLGSRQLRACELPWRGRCRSQHHRRQPRKLQQLRRRGYDHRARRFDFLDGGQCRSELLQKRHVDGGSARYRRDSARFKRK